MESPHPDVFFGSGLAVKSPAMTRSPSGVAANARFILMLNKIIKLRPPNTACTGFLGTNAA